MKSRRKIKWGYSSLLNACKIACTTRQHKPAYFLYTMLYAGAVLKH